MIQKRLINIFVAMVSLVCFIGYIYVLLNHIDVFFTGKKSSAQLINFKNYNESRNNTITLRYFDVNTDSTRERLIKFKDEWQIKDPNDVPIVYTKWFDQILLDGFNVPRMIILIFDVFMLLVFGYGIRIGLSK